MYFEWTKSLTGAFSNLNCSVLKVIGLVEIINQSETQLSKESNSKLSTRDDPPKPVTNNHLESSCENNPSQVNPITFALFDKQTQKNID